MKKGLKDTETDRYIREWEKVDALVTVYGIFDRYEVYLLGRAVIRQTAARNVVASLWVKSGAHEEKHMVTGYAQRAWGLSKEQVAMVGAMKKIEFIETAMLQNPDIWKDDWTAVFKSLGYGVVKIVG